MTDTFDLDEHLPHLWEPPPDSERESPAGWEDRKASENKNDRLAGAIEKINTAAAENSQQKIKGSGGKQQGFCSTACRKASHPNPNVVPHVYDNPKAGAHVGENVGKDVGKCPNVGAEPVRWAPTPPEDEFQRLDDRDVVLRTQHDTAVYFNKFDEVVIRQQRFDDDDSFIYIQQTFIREFINRLCETCGIPISWERPDGR